MCVLGLIPIPLRENKLLQVESAHPLYFECAAGGELTVYSIADFQSKCLWKTIFAIVV